MKLEAVLFDCDGVISETEKDGHQRAFNKVFERENLPVFWDDQLYSKLLNVGGGKERLDFFFHEYGWPKKVKNKEQYIRHLHQLKSRLFGELVKNGEMKIRLGIIPLMRELVAEKIPFGICSTSKKESLKLITDKLLGKEIIDNLSLLISGDDVVNKKPDPEVYQMAAKRLNVHPENCVVIEDSDIGMRSAREAGMKVIITKSHYTKDHSFQPADRILDDLSSVNLCYLSNLIKN